MLQILDCFESHSKGVPLVEDARRSSVQVSSFLQELQETLST